MDYVIRAVNILFVFDPFADTPRQDILDSVYDQMLADEFVVGGKVNGVAGDPAGLVVPTCYSAIRFATGPNPIVILQQFQQATHGFFCNNANTRQYWAGKARFRIGTSRRWCVESCEHVVPPTGSGCPGASTCDPAGNLMSTLFPASGTFEVIPDRLAIIDRPFTNVKHDYTWKRAFFDSEPPASPFCGVP